MKKKLKKNNNNERKERRGSKVKQVGFGIKRKGLG